MNDQEKPGLKSGLSDFKADIVIAWLPFLVIFLIIPFAVYLPNQIEYEYNFSVMTPFFVFASLSFIFTALVLYIIGLIRHSGLIWRKRISMFSFYAGVFFLLSDIFTPVKWGLLDGVSKITEPISLTLIQIVFIAGLCLCAYKLPANVVRKFGVPLVIILLVIQPVYIFSGLDKQTVWSEGDHSEYPSKPSEIRSGNQGVGNIYQIVFDKYSSLYFIDALKEMKLGDKFDGFTFFKKNLSNYTLTVDSVASFLTGTFYKKGSFPEWQSQPTKYGLIAKLQNIGHKTWVYSPNRTKNWCYKNASYIRTTRDITSSMLQRSFYLTGVNPDTLSVLQISLVRTAPNFLRRQVFAKSNRVFGHLLRMFNKIPQFFINKAGEIRNHIEKYRSFKDPRAYKGFAVELFREMIADEQKRGEFGEYVYCHIILPHPSFLWDRNCNYSQDSNYYEQTLCATRLMTEFIDELKRLGRFERSLIIFQSDHGNEYDDPGKLPNMDVSNEITQNIFAGSREKQNQYLFRLHSLLLTKAPFASNKRMVISEAPTQLADIPSTIYDIAGISADSLEGRAIFKINDSEQREIFMYYRYPEKGSIWRCFSYTNGKRWRVYPEVPIIDTDVNAPDED